MKVLFVGLLYNPQNEIEYLGHSRVGISVASNLYQWNVINGLKENGIQIEVLGSLPYGNYPRFSDVIYVKDAQYCVENIDLLQIGYINYYVIKHIVRERKIKKFIHQWIEKNKDENCLVMFYDLQDPFLNTINWMKRFKSVKTCLIVPDLVGDLRNDVGIKGLKGLLIKRKANSILNKARNADSYILLTKHMNTIINTKNRPFVIIDGIVDESVSSNILVPDKRVIMYAGNISEQYNIKKLLVSFRANNDSNLRLWFCGKGTAVKDVIDASKEDKRIKYFGFLSKEKLKELEKKVCFYINPRTNNGEYTRYSFPSKNLEYLLSGKPVIAYKLDGMSDDYDDVFLYLSEKEDGSIDKMLECISNMDEHQIAQLALKGEEFVKNHNGRKMQCKKIIGLFERVFYDSK